MVRKTRPPVPWRLGRENLTADRSFYFADLLESSVEAILVRMVVTQNGLVTGWDLGAVGFDEDAVWFSGRACSFRVFAADILPRLSGDGRNLENSFHLVHPRRNIMVSFDVLPFGQRIVAQDEKLLDAHLIRLRQSRRSEGISQYPPLTPRSDLLKRRLRRPSSAGWIALGSVAVAASWLWPLTIPLTIGFAALVATTGGPFQNRQQALLRRIEAEELRGGKP